MALTYLNCITFNELWGKYIAEVQRKERTPPEPLARVRQQKRMDA